MRTPLISAALSAALLLAACSSIPATHVRDFLAEAQTMQKRGMLREAAEAARSAMDEHPDDVRAHLLFQELMIRRGGKDEIIARYRRLAERNPENALLQFLYGNVAPDPDVKKRKFLAATALDPALTWAYRGLLPLLDPRGDADELINTLEKLARLEPERPELLRELGLALFYAGRIDEAMRYMSMFLAEKPDNARAKEELAVALVISAREKIRAGGTAIARDLAGRVLDMFPDSKPAAFAMADAALMDKKPDEALLWAEKAGDHYRLGLARKMKGENKKAAEEFKAAVRHDPAHADAYAALGKMLEEGKKYNEAMELYTVAASAIPNEPVFHMLLGRAARKAGDNERARAAYDRFLDAAPRTSRAWKEVVKELIEIEREMRKETDKVFDEVEKLIRDIESPDKTVRQKALFLLNRTLGKRAYPHMAGSLSSKYDDVRVFAVRSLGLYGRREAIGPLVKMLADANPDVRRETVLSLRELGPAWSAGALAGRLEDADAGVRKAALGALRTITKDDFGFKSPVEPEKQKTALDRWKTWLKGFEKKLKETKK